MPFQMRLGLLLRGVAKLIAAVAVASVLGVGVGIGLAALSGDDDSKQKAATTQPKTTQAASGADVQIVSAYLQLGATPSGRRRHRARLSIHVRVTNNGKTTIAELEPLLIGDQTTLRPDPKARPTTGSLLRPVAPGETAGGPLRFETAGALTDELDGKGRARLRIGGKMVSLKLKLGAPPA